MAYPTPHDTVSASHLRIIFIFDELFCGLSSDDVRAEARVTYCFASHIDDRGDAAAVGLFTDDARFDTRRVSRGPRGTLRRRCGH